MKVVRIDQRVEVLSPTSRRMVLPRDRQAREVLQTTFRPDHLSNRGAHRVGRLDVAIIWDGRLGRRPIITSTCAMGTNLSFDEEGLELRDMKAVQEEAARALAGLAWDSVRNFNGAQSDQMTIEVRDNLGSVMQVRFAFEIARRQ